MPALNNIETSICQIFHNGSYILRSTLESTATTPDTCKVQGGLCSKVTQKVTRYTDEATRTTMNYSAWGIYIGYHFQYGNRGLTTLKTSMYKHREGERVDIGCDDKYTYG